MMKQFGWGIGVEASAIDKYGRLPDCIPLAHFEAL
jgi:hypothetical protein